MRVSLRPLGLVMASVMALAACSAAASSPTTSAPASQAPGATATDPAASGPGTTPGGTLTIYSGRSEELVGPLIDKFEAETGIETQVNYAGTTDLAATILEEGDASPADVFFAQDAGALGAIDAERRLSPLPSSTLDLVDPRFRADDGNWVGVSGRARVVVYDSRSLTEADLPTAIEEYTDPDWKGKIGWAPTNASFQSFITAYRILEGDDAAKAWLEGIQANEPKVYDGNDAVLAAVAAGEIEVGFVNHYYLMRQLAEQGESFPVRNHFLPGGDPGSLVNVAGVAILATAPNKPGAQAFVDFLLSEESQAYFATETYEYPLLDGVPADPGLPALSEIQSPEIDLTDLADLQGTLTLLQEAGVL